MTHLAVNALAATRGGAVTQLRPLLLALRAARPAWQITVFVSNARLLREMEGVEVVTVPVAGGMQRAWLEWYELQRVAARRGAVIMVNLLNSGAMIARLPAVTWQRNALYFDRGWLASEGALQRLEAAVRRNLALLTCRASGAVVVPSAAMAGLVKDWRLGRRLLPVVVPHGVDAGAFPFKPREPIAPVKLGVMGHAARHRGLDTAVDVLGRLVARGVDGRLLLTVPRTGNPAFQDEVDMAASLAGKLGIENRVEYCGAVSDPPSWYQSIDILLVPSACESFGFPVLEGLCSGTLVVTSGIGALREVGGENAHHAPERTPAALTDAVHSALAEKHEERGKRLRAGRERAEAFTWDRSARALLEAVEAEL